MELLNTNRKSQVRSKFGPGRKNWGSRGGAPDPGASAASPPGDKSSMEAEGPGPFSLSQPRTYCTGPRPRPPGSPPYGEKDIGRSRDAQGDTRGTRGTRMHGHTDHTDKPHKHPSQPTRPTRTRTGAHHTHTASPRSQPGQPTEPAALTEPRGRLRKDHSQRYR